MDRAEAYQLLTERMRIFAADELRPDTANGLVVSENASGPVSGAHYTIEVKLVRSPKGIFSLHGSIHDNNAMRFELLEERLEVERK